MNSETQKLLRQLAVCKLAVNIAPSGVAAVLEIQKQITQAKKRAHLAAVAS